MPQSTLKVIVWQPEFRTLTEKIRRGAKKPVPFFSNKDGEEQELHGAGVPCCKGPAGIVRDYQSAGSVRATSIRAKPIR